MNEVDHFGVGGQGVGESKYSPFMFGSLVGVMAAAA